MWEIEYACQVSSPGVSLLFANPYRTLNPSTNTNIKSNSMNTNTNPYRSLGTPNNRRWSGMTGLPDFQPSFPQWEPLPLHTLAPGADTLCVDVLKGLLCPPQCRMHAQTLLDGPCLKTV